MRVQRCMHPKQQDVVTRDHHAGQARQQFGFLRCCCFESHKRPLFNLLAPNRSVVR